MISETWPVSNSLSRSQRRKFFPVIRSTPHTKGTLSGNTQRSTHCLLICLSYFPQELEFSPKARPCSHLDKCIIIFCLPKGPHILLNTTESQDLRTRAQGFFAHHPTSRGVTGHQQTLNISRGVSCIRNINTVTKALE